MNVVEICIDSDNKTHLVDNITKVYQVGAQRIELCSAMSEDGLTPCFESINLARQVFKRSGLMVMIRPRAGGFCYNTQEIDLMVEQIKAVAELGADGVVFGVLADDGMSFNLDAMQQLVMISRTLDLEVGIHRAFDAVRDKKATLFQLISLGVDRVLTSGTPWGSSSSATAGMENLLSFAKLAGRNIELVIAGGISPKNAGVILAGFNDTQTTVSLHAYSSVLNERVIDYERVQALINAFPEY